MTRRIALPVTIAVFSLSAAGIVFGVGQIAPDEPDPHKIRFETHCSQVGQGENGGLGAVTCTLTVSGLPAPLGGQVAVTLVAGEDQVGGPAGDTGSMATAFSAEAPAAAEVAPVLQTQELTEELPSLLSITPQVPVEPPRFV